MRRTILGVLALSLGLLPGAASAIGILIPTDRSYGPMAIESHRVEVEITDRAAVTKVDQVFLNSTDQVLEATYIFPLPAGSSVSQFALWINGERTEGEVLEHDAAARIYQDIVARLRDPGLIEYMGGNLFKARVFPIPARGEQRVEIEFTSVLSFESGVYRYIYPMKTSGEAARTMRDFTVTARIDSAIPIQSIYSPTHEIDINRRDDHHATAGFERDRADLGKDFQLFFTVSSDDVGLSLLTHRPAGEDGFFMMMVTPRNDLEDDEIMGKHVTFVIDTSGSMSGDKMDKAKDALNFCLEHLRSDDLFNIIRFSSDVDLFSEAPVNASESHVEEAKEFVDRMRALGGTAISDALAAALDQPEEEGVPHIIVFLTDGMPTVGQTDPDRIVDDVERSNGHRARIFVFGLGEDVNANFLDSISQENRGASEYAQGGEELEQKLSGFYGKIAFPVMADLVVKVDGDAEIYDVFPRELPDLFHGGQLLLLGRYRDDGDAEVVLGGKVGAQTKTFSYEVGFPEREGDNDFLAHMWATRKVGYLLDNIRLNGEESELVDEVVTLGRRYGIVTPYTSFLVTEDAPVTTARRGQQPWVVDEVQQWQYAPAEPEAFGGDDGDWGGYGGGWADSATVAAPSAAPPAMPMGGARADYERYRALSALPGTAGQTGTEAAEGETGRRMSEELRDMREADRQETSGVTRYVAGRLFVHSGGAWVEDGASGASETLEIEYLSDAYFDLLAAHPELGEVLSLGENVTLRAGEGKAIVVRTASGRSSVSAGELEDIFED
ncbi:MAG: VWA domain-containing protein [Deltaproteobacteria bacterium]|nr:VWA domain-containing protein [Deltaproteobacteria bacterium]